MRHRAAAEVQPLLMVRLFWLLPGAVAEVHPVTAVVATATVATVAEMLMALVHTEEY